VIRYILDTDILSLYQHKHTTIREYVSGIAADDLGITVISVEEQLTGWYTYLRKAKTRSAQAHAYERLARNVAELANLPIITYTEAAIDRYERLKAQKMGIRAMDLRIAAVCLEAGATLVTRNTRDFSRIPGLAIEDWSVEV
jgi:tRNA(fMet)-specific endonuclease VapC